LKLKSPCGPHGRVIGSRPPVAAGIELKCEPDATMTPQELSRYAEAGYNRVAITRHLLADLDTPLSA